MKALKKTVTAVRNMFVENLKDYNAEIVCGMLALNGNTGTPSIYTMLKK